MSYTLKVNYADKSNYGASRSTSKIKYIVIHYTANDGDTDEANAKYFKRKNIKASANMFVDDDSVTISVPDTVVAWSVGGSRYKNYKSTGGAKYYGKCTNNNSISIEMCDTIKDGKIMASEKTMQNTAELVKELMAKYNVPIENVIRHFDCTGKSCPSYFVDQNAWNNFKTRLGGSVVSTPSQPSTTTPSTDLVSIGKVHARNFIGQSNTSKNIDSLTLKQLKSMVLQRGINLDYNKGLTLDGAFGSNSKSALGTHYVKLGEKQYMVTCAEILMYLNGKNPNGVELPAMFDDRLVKASGKSKITASDFLSYIA